MDHLAVTWFGAAIAVSFLAVCAAHNRRTGYRKERATETPVEEALLWLSALRTALIPSRPEPVAPAQRPARQTGKPIPAVGSVHSEELLRLRTALQGSGTALPVAARAAATMPAEAKASPGKASPAQETQVREHELSASVRH